MSEPVQGKDRITQIVQAAASCFQEKGYQSTSLQDVAEAVQLQKPTLYHYIASKNELLYLVLQQTAESYNYALQTVVNSALNPVAKMDQAIRQHISLQLENMGTVTLFRDVYQLDQPYRDKIRLALKLYRELLQMIIREGIDRGDFAAQDASLSALLILGAINFVHRWYHPQGPLSVSAIADAYSTQLLQTLTAKS